MGGIRFRNMGIEYRNKVGNGLKLDNVNNKVNVGQVFNDTNMTVADPEFTIFATFKFNLSGGTTAIYAQNSLSGALTKIAIRIEESGGLGRFRFLLQRDDGSTSQIANLFSDYLLKDGEIYSVAWTCSGNGFSNLAAYLNESPLGSFGSGNFTGNYFPTGSVGHGYLGSTNSISSSAHTFYSTSLWKRGLSPAEIADLTSTYGDVNALSNHTNLKVWLPFNQSRGDIVSVAGPAVNIEGGSATWVDELGNTAF